VESVRLRVTIGLAFGTGIDFLREFPPRFLARFVRQFQWDVGIHANVTDRHMRLRTQPVLFGHRRSRPRSLVNNGVRITGEHRRSLS
jgi:hypothetical protein